MLSKPHLSSAFFPLQFLKAYRHSVSEIINLSILNKLILLLKASYTFKSQIYKIGNNSDRLNSDLLFQPPTSLKQQFDCWLINEVGLWLSLHLQFKKSKFIITEIKKWNKKLNTTRKMSYSRSNWCFKLKKAYNSWKKYPTYNY